VILGFQIVSNVDPLMECLQRTEEAGPCQTSVFKIHHDLQCLARNEHVVMMVYCVLAPWMKLLLSSTIELMRWVETLPGRTALVRLSIRHQNSENPTTHKQ